MPMASREAGEFRPFDRTSGIGIHACMSYYQWRLLHSFDHLLHNNRELQKINYTALV